MPASWPVAVFVAVVVAAVAVWMYPPQVRRLPSVWRWVLPGLRVAAVAAVAVSALRPVLVRPKSAAELGTVVVVTDASASMNVVDPRSPAERVALAGALGNVPSAVGGDALADVRADLDALAVAAADAARARAELDYARLAGRGGAAAQGRGGAAARTVAALVAKLAGTQVPEAGELADRLADLRPAAGDARRLDDAVARARAAVTSARAAKDERRYHADAAVRQAADAAAARTRYTIATAAASRVAAAFPADVPTANVTAGEVTPASDKGAVAPTAPATDLPAAVAAALTGQAGRPVRAVVLLTDGRQTTDGDPAALTAVAAAAVPVFPVKLTATAPPADVAVAGVDVPPRAFVGETVPVAVRIRSDAAGPAALDVRLAVEGQPPQQKKVTLDDGGRGAAEFGVKAEAAGTLVLSVTFDKVGDEQVVTNNVAHRRVRVLADKLKVAAYAGAPAWDFQYLRNALQRSAWASAQDAVLATGGRLPLTPKEIAEQDVVVLADVPAAAVDDAQWDALNQLVAERGGSVIFMPGDVGRLAEYAARPLAQSLLPYRAEVKPAWRVWPGERSGLRVVPAEGRADALPLAEAPAESAKRWQALPPVFRVLSPPALKLNARPLLIEAESKSPVVIESRVGRGRSIFVGVNETWRWRYKVGERDQDRFLTGLVRYAVDAPYAARDGGVALDVEKAAVAPGEAVRVRAKVLGDEGLPVAGPPTVVRVTPSGDAARAGDGGAAVAAVPLTESDAPGRFTGTLSDLPAGTYEVSIEAAGKRVALPLIVETTTERELVDLSGGDAMPKRLAESTGGAVFDVEDLERLPALLASAGDPRSRILERPLWDGPWVYGIVLACLGTEWALRKRFGLA